MTDAHHDQHTPWPVTVETGETIGGVNIITGLEVQIRCGCENHLGYDYGHQETTQ